MEVDLTTRELAVTTWAVVLFGWALTKPSIRDSIGEVVRSALHPKLLAVAMVIAVYTVAMVWVLDAAGFWTRDLLKDTVLWFVFSGIAIGGAALTSQPDEIIRRTVINSAKVVVVLEFLLNTYTFPLPIELVLVPALAFIGMLDAVAQSDAKYSSVARLTTGVQAFVGLAIVGFALVQAVAKFDSLASVSSLRAVLLVPVLSLLFIPCVFILSLLSAYELLFLRLSFAPAKDQGVIAYAKRQLIWHLGLRPQKVRVFARDHAADLMHVDAREDVDRLLRD